LKSQIPQNIRHNLVFLIAEVSSHISNLQHYISHPSSNSAASILERSGYAFNLKIRIQQDEHDYIARQGENETNSMVFRAVNSIASHLDRIAKLCRDCIQHATKLKSRDILQADEYELLLDRVAWGISLIDRAISDNDMPLVIKISHVEQQLKSSCQKLIEKYSLALRSKKNTDDLISALFIARSVDNMGDALLNISESLLSGMLGQAINMERYHSLHGFVEQLKEDKQQKIVVKTIAETRSGSAISSISVMDDDERKMLAVFKDGKKHKLNEERESVNSWHKIYPGIAPKILSYNKQGKSAALLIEHLEGLTFEGLLLKESPQLQNQALKKLCHTLKSIWQTTRRKKKVSAHYMRQLKRRMPEVYRVHPQFKQGKIQISDLKVVSLETLIKRAEVFEKALKPCFSVYIHGDFNSDNIIYDPLEKKINFIDLHRSCYMDYVQDVSVFMVSNYRLQALDSKLRQRVLKLTLNFYQFAAQFAQKNADKSFELRLALGLARSFASSTRFILDKTLAKAMVMRSQYLLEQLLALKPHQSASYRVPIKEIFID